MEKWSALLDDFRAVDPREPKTEDLREVVDRCRYLRKKKGVTEAIRGVARLNPETLKKGQTFK
jgi:hypothetical protein